MRLTSFTEKQHCFEDFANFSEIETKVPDKKILLITSVSLLNELKK